MASLSKLAIRGIRSFDDKEIAIMEFFSPVTVIVGHNGSGKTTIIECLKYAATGDQPPNTRGGAFIHDPKMANEKEVKAQVKLRFIAANGTRMVAVRNLSVTVKKTGLTTKTLESILAIDDSVEKRGKRGVISTKCAEMDAEIPQLLGVSKAVLENVIFCHQEDSYWPLAEPGVLKKKFDDIFEATRYTKALDNIKNLRKDRAAELKAEKERLNALLIKKGHADKLKDRMSNLSATISGKEIQYNNVKRQYDELFESNTRFYELNKTFRELYIKVTGLEEKNQETRQNLARLQSKYQEIEGTYEELKEREAQFLQHQNGQEEKLAGLRDEVDEIEESMQGIQEKQRQILEQRGRLEMEAQQQEQRKQEREVMIQKIAQAYDLLGYDHSPLEREEIQEFVARLSEVQRRHGNEFENLQRDSASTAEEYRSKQQDLENTVHSLTIKKENLREQAKKLNRSISDNERVLEDLGRLPAMLATLQSDVQEKRQLIDKNKADLASARYDIRLSEKTEAIKQLDVKRETLNNDLQMLSSQAESRAGLGLKRTEVKNKKAEVETKFRSISSKVQSFGKEITLENAEAVVERLFAEKEAEESNATREFSLETSNLKRAEADISQLKSDLKTKEAEMKQIDRELKGRLDGASTVQEALRMAQDEIDLRANDLLASSAPVYERILEDGRKAKTCTACKRHMNANELAVFEQSMLDAIAKSTSKAMKETRDTLEDWKGEYSDLQSFLPKQTRLDLLQSKEIPDLKAKIQQLEDELPDVAATAEKAEEDLERVRRQLKDLGTARQTVANVASLQKEIRRLNQEIEGLEQALASTGSTRTADDVREELSNISTEMRRLDREKTTITAERDGHNLRLQTFQRELHELELEGSRLELQVQKKESLEAEIERARRDINAGYSEIRELDQQIADAKLPLEDLRQEYERTSRDFQQKIDQAGERLRSLNQQCDRLSDMNKGIERRLLDESQRYVKDKKSRQLDLCRAELQRCDADAQEHKARLETVRATISSIEREVHESGATLSNLRDNIIARDLMKQIAATQAEIDSHDMEEAAKARRNYEDKYEPLKQKETSLLETYNRLGGELSTLRAQLTVFEGELKEYKDAYKQYTEQLIRVKMSDMANNDLEKYAKALDNAIMKYHGLKMAEVNDTMKHLWNKTYQGTDIDGIKIVSDAEGNATKRSYNYRVVMTKDQVEMDMRGRCSAGQKMLASIIIRLALSDSFGQNCGILALDEPTNALDTENIDALASSLVDIINERKSHSNFQLIVITHDENFLRKLGHSDVMDQYWRVVRNSKQKSIIERQRFR